MLFVGNNADFKIKVNGIRVGAVRIANYINPILSVIPKG